MYVPITAMYQAARQGLPDRAEHLGGIAGHLVTVVDGFDRETARAGDPPGLRDALMIVAQIHDGIRRGVATLNNAALALEATADDYVATDQQARDEFNSWQGPVKDMEVPLTDVPADIGNPEDSGFVVGGRDPDPGGIPRWVPPSEYDPDTPAQDRGARDETAQQDSDDLGLPDDPTDDY